MLQAAAKGTIDFSKYQPFDRFWNLKVKWMLQQVEVENIRQLYAMQHNQHCSALSYTAGKDIFEHHWKPASELLDNFMDLLFPWSANKDKRSKLDYDSMRKKVIELYGDPADPETQEKIRKTVEGLKALKPKKRNKQFTNKK